MSRTEIIWDKLAIVIFLANSQIALTVVIHPCECLIMKTLESIFYSNCEKYVQNKLKRIAIRKGEGGVNSTPRRSRP